MIATRSSALALRQAEEVRDRLRALGVEASLHTYETLGDKRLDQPLSEIGAKGLFTAELEADLLAGRVDCCVHSLKDLPTAQPEGLALAAFLTREDPRDVLIVPTGSFVRSLAELPSGARVGTSSLRRRAQLRAMRPDVEAVELRGNVPTRIRKVDEGQVDAAILAAAGVRRLGLGERIAAVLDAPEWLPAAGQGAIAVQVRAADFEVGDIIARLNDAGTARAVSAERSFLEALEGGCQVPIGAMVVGEQLHGFVAALDGKTVVRGARLLGGDPAAIGRALASELRMQGAEAILRELATIHGVPRPQPE